MATYLIIKADDWETLQENELLKAKGTSEETFVGDLFQIIKNHCELRELPEEK